MNNINRLVENVTLLRTEANMAYNMHRDAIDALFTAEQNLAEARRTL